MQFPLRAVQSRAGARAWRHRFNASPSTISVHLLSRP